MSRLIASDPKHKHASAFKKISLRVNHVWTYKQNKIFVKALQKHGKDYQKIGKYFPTVSKEIIVAHAGNLKRDIKSDKDHPYANLKETLEKRSGKFWSKKEEDTFIKMIKKYGKNYKLIKTKLPTKTLAQVSGHTSYLNQKIKRNPKYRHSAMKK